ncbi:hypothetical protein BV25DRAFT_1797002, partial [Artomyces pyxidatus]
DYYALLGVTRSASPASIKTAYHHALLRLHPDKQVATQQPGLDAATEHIDIGGIKDAFVTLSTPALRAAYDRELGARAEPKGPRPAQVISLEEFVEAEGEWTHACRCGGVYRITEAEMEKGQHLVGCGGCSEVVWAGYEAVEDE